jgi:hypothetical protein
MLFRQLLTDYQMLATAGGDFAKRNENGQPDANTSIVPDKYDPLYARCGATAALDTMLVGYGTTFPLLAGLPSRVKDSNKALTVAHKCIIEGAKGDIHMPAKDDEFDTEGPAPAAASPSTRCSRASRSSTSTPRRSRATSAPPRTT